MIKVFIADDHIVVREGLKQIIAETPDMVVVDEASSGPEVLDKVKKNECDVLVLDITMPGKGGLDIIKELKGQNTHFPVLILSMHPEKQFAVRALKAGASGYLTKESATEELIAAIRRISQGRKYVTPSLAEKLAFHLEVDTVKPSHEILSDREYQVMRKIASGKSINEIAEELFLSPRTVSTYRARIMEKMNVRNNVELTRYAMRHGLVD
jgi:DNA-binding NarL/FixJ family response regulator